jgi:thiol-disulfide isomerase/thioredoxin
MPKVRGVVRDEDGNPVADAVVRFRGSMLTYAVAPVVTDENGHFELSPPWVPDNWQTHERLPIQFLVAFHPTKRLYAATEVRLDDPESLDNVEIQLEPQDLDSVITRFENDLTPWQRGVMDDERKDELAAISLHCKVAPDLDGVHWMNTDKPNMSLADFRGKYVLLQFWTTWCGPCHADMPSLRVLDRLYRDKGLVIIGIHDNSMPLAAIEADVAKEELRYPIVVDHPDGRIMARYQEHGVSGFPSYLLIGPDGTVIYDDETIPAPSLRSFKIEIIRELLLADDHAAPAAATKKRAGSF